LLHSNLDAAPLPAQDVNIETLSPGEMEEWIVEKIELNESPILSHRAAALRAVRLLVQFREVLNINGEFSQTDLLEHPIHTHNLPPIKQRRQLINPSLEPSLRAQIDTWEKHNVIENSTSPWSLSLVAVPKKGAPSGGAWTTGDSTN
jgi:hypothetical protein